MGQNRKTYSETFKKKVAKEALAGGKTLQEVAAENGVSPSQVCKWKQTLMDGGFSKELKKAQKDLDEARRKLEEAQKLLGKKDLMIEILKEKVNLTDDAFTNL